MFSETIVLRIVHLSLIYLCLRRLLIPNFVVLKWILWRLLKLLLKVTIKWIFRKLFRKLILMMIWKILKTWMIILEFIRLILIKRLRLVLVIIMIILLIPLNIIFLSSPGYSLIIIWWLIRLIKLINFSLSFLLKTFLRIKIWLLLIVIHFYLFLLRFISL